MRIFILPLPGRERIHAVITSTDRESGNLVDDTLDRPVVLSLDWKSLNDATSGIQLESSVSSREIRLYEILLDGNALSQVDRIVIRHQCKP